MYDDFQIISNNIKSLREKKGFTQEQLAEAADLSVSHLSKVESGQRRIGMKAYLTVLKALDVDEEIIIQWESGEYEPTISMLIPLANVLGCDPMWLLTSKPTAGDTCA